jgi:hypothetical protein
MRAAGTLLLITLSACVGGQPDLSLTSTPNPDHSVILRWSATGAERLVLIDGDEASEVTTSGERRIEANEQEKIVRVGALSRAGTTWSTQVVGGQSTERSGCRGRVQFDSAPESALSVNIDRRPVGPSPDGSFEVPNGSSSYDLVLRRRKRNGQTRTVGFNDAKVCMPSTSMQTYEALSADLDFAVSSEGLEDGRGLETVVVALVGTESTQTALSSSRGEGRLQNIKWTGTGGDRTSTAKVSAVRILNRRAITGNARDLAEIVATSEPADVVLRSGEIARVNLRLVARPSSTREVLVPSEGSRVEHSVTFGLSGLGGLVYSASLGTISSINTFADDSSPERWIVRGPASLGMQGGGAGISQYPLPSEGPIIAPAYRAPQVTTFGAGSGLVLSWDSERPILCLATVFSEIFDEWLIYTTTPFAVGDFGITERGDYTVSLDCFPEHSSVTDAFRMFHVPGNIPLAGRLARTRTLTQFSVR